MYPFEQQWTISDTFADHLIPNPLYPGREKEPGTDYRADYKSKIKAMFPKTLIDIYINEFGTKYLVQINPETKQRVDFIHAFVDVPINSIVDEGTIVGRTDGVSDYPKRSSGAHVLVTYRPDGKTYQDPVPFLNSQLQGGQSTVQVTGNSPYIPDTYFQSETAPVFAGEGLAAVATRAGLPNPDTEAAWIQLAGLNGWGDNWQGFNASLQANQQVKVRSTQKPLEIVPTTIVEQAIEKENQTKEEVKDAIVNHTEVIKNKIEDNNEIIAQKQAEAAQKAQENQELALSLNEFIKTTGGSYGLENLAYDIIKEEVKSKGIVAKWHAFVDSKNLPTILNSLLKYDWPWILFVTVTIFTLLAPLYAGSDQLVLAILSGGLGFAGFILKFISSNVNLDRNKDGKIDFTDTWTYEQLIKGRQV